MTRIYRIFGFESVRDMKSGRPKVGINASGNYPDEALENLFKKYPAYAKKCDLWGIVPYDSITKIASNRKGEIRVL